MLEAKKVVTDIIMHMSYKYTLYHSHLHKDKIIENDLDILLKGIHKFHKKIRHLYYVLIILHVMCSRVSLPLKIS
jgi:hypothetical protein